MKTRFGFETLKLEGEPESALSGGGAPIVDAPQVDAPPVDAPSIYGDLDVKFPEGMDDSLKMEPSLKSFVDKESGEINYGNMMKSYVHNTKQVGVNKVVIPGEGASKEELDEFHSKLGYQPDEADYKVTREEDASISEERVAEIKAFARENRLPSSVAQKMIDKENTMISDSAVAGATKASEEIATALEGLKTEWGQAYDQKLSVASRVLKEVVNSEEVNAVFANPAIGSNPAVIKALSMIGEKLFKEDGFKGEPTGGMLSPAEAGIEINEIMADMKGAYWNKNHASHNDVVSKVQKLMIMKNGG